MSAQNTSSQRILLAEDEQHLQRTLQLNLEMEGYEVVATSYGTKALKLFSEQRFDLVVLDVMLPEVDGFRVCERIRLDDRKVPILFLTAKATDEDRIAGLKKGANDYLVKPFNLEELLLRIQNLLRHSLKQHSKPDKLQTYNFGDNAINFATYEAKHGKKIFRLSQKEAKLLQLLIKKQGEVVSRQEILESVWGYEVYPTTRTIDNFILGFRKKFERDPKNPRYFRSIRGVGYKFQAP